MLCNIFTKDQVLYINGLTETIQYKLLDYLTNYVYNTMKIIFLILNVEDNKVVIKCINKKDTNTLMNISKKWLNLLGR